DYDDAGHFHFTTAYESKLYAKYRDLHDHRQHPTGSRLAHLFETGAATSDTNRPRSAQQLS
ncbi:MAG: hypothetical protein WAN81_18865, partial [Candidatus Binataceae bacterium]